MPPMQFQTTKENLLRLVTPAAAAVQATGPNKLATVLMEVHSSMVRVTGTDLITDITTEQALTSVEAVTGGAVAVEAKRLAQLAASMPAGGIIVKRLDGDWMEFKSTNPKAKATMKLRGYHASTYPTPDHKSLAGDEADRVDVNINALRKLIRSTLYAVSRDEARANLCQLHFERNGKAMIAVSTDGHRMATAMTLCTFPAIPSQPGINLTRRSAALLLGLLDNIPSVGDAGVVRVSYAPGMLSVANADNGYSWTLTAKLADQVFPPWQQVVPNTHTRVCAIGRTALEAMIGRALAMAPDQTHATLFGFDEVNGGEVSVRVDNPDQGVLHDVSGDVKLTGAGVSATYNVQYLSEALAHMAGDTITFKLNGHMDSVLLHGDSETEACAVVMPMRM